MRKTISELNRSWDRRKIRIRFGSLDCKKRRYVYLGGGREFCCEDRSGVSLRAASSWRRQATSERRRVSKER